MTASVASVFSGGKFLYLANFRRLTIETENLSLNGLASLQDFHLTLSAIAHNYTIRCKH